MNITCKDCRHSLVVLGDEKAIRRQLEAFARRNKLTPPEYSSVERELSLLSGSLAEATAALVCLLHAEQVDDEPFDEDDCCDFEPL